MAQLGAGAAVAARKERSTTSPGVRPRKTTTPPAAAKACSLSSAGREMAEEEGTTFNLGMLGSRAWTGSLSAEQLAALKNKQGQSYLEAGHGHGVDAGRLAAERFSAAAYRGLIEVHVEQGLALWTSDVPVALVTAINGRRQFAVTVTGQPNHAGSTKMAHRQDALAADVFGSPGYVLDGEAFWGQDRLELLADALKSGRAAYSSKVS